ncbi:MAG: hypothetical protein KAS87_01095 [Candidatus Omnitrophica bacterium]|nr:hypothetical protein [Candidatus Omnitrophota bacterium]
MLSTLLRWLFFYLLFRFLFKIVFESGNVRCKSPKADKNTFNKKNVIDVESEEIK